jgi:hypothetical protein
MGAAAAAERLRAFSRSAVAIAARNCGFENGFTT